MVILDKLISEFCHNKITWDARSDNSKLSPSLTTMSEKLCFECRGDAGSVPINRMLTLLTAFTLWSLPTSAF